MSNGHLQFFDIDHGKCKSIILQQVRRDLGLALRRGWANPMPDRCRGLIQHPNQPRPKVKAAEATDKDNKEARAFYQNTQSPLAMGGRPLEGALCLGFSC